MTVPREAIESLWMSFNLHGDGWGLDCDQLKEIFLGAKYMKDTIGTCIYMMPLFVIMLYLTGFQLDDVVKLFKTFDTDGNELIDSLELLITLALASG